MEGFTLVLSFSWLLLLGAFAVMYRLDQITAERRATQSGSPPERSR